MDPPAESSPCIENNSVVEDCIGGGEDHSTTEDYLDFSQLPSVRIVFIFLYFTVMIMAVLGNAAVVITVLTNRKMQTVVNYYIVNLAICDFMVGIFVLPIKLLELTAPASWGALNDGLCTAVLYTQTVIVFASVLTLVATSIERYLAIVHPLESRIQQSKSRTVKILVIVWLLPCLGAGPFLYPSEAVSNRLTSSYGTIERLTCFTNFDASFRRIYYTFLFVFFYAIPLSFITWTCCKIARCLLRTTATYREGSLRRQDANRRKVAKMILMVVVAFAISWTPYFLVTIITQYSSVNYMQHHNFFFTMLCINFCGFLNSSVNPVIYVIMSTRFRTGFTQILRFIFCASCGEDSRPPSVAGMMMEGNDGPSHDQRLLPNGDCVDNDKKGRKRDTSLALIGKYHRRIVLLACGGPTNISTDSCPTDSGHENQSRKVNLEVHYRPSDEKATIETTTTTCKTLISNGHLAYCPKNIANTNLSYSTDCCFAESRENKRHYVTRVNNQSNHPPDSLPTQGMLLSPYHSCYHHNHQCASVPRRMNGDQRAHSVPSLPVTFWCQQHQVKHDKDGQSSDNNNSRHPD